MKIIGNGVIIETDSPAEAIHQAVWSFAVFDGEQLLPPEVEVIRVWALSYLNAWRGERRAATGLTSAAFQELCYTGKALECQRWIADQESPFGLAMEAAARGISDLAMAQLVLSQWAAWMAASDVIEADYVDAKTVIEDASTVEEIGAVLAGMV